jgi:predicted dehydrogenase
MAPIVSLKAGVIGYGVGRIYAAGLRGLRSYYPDLPEIELVEIATRSEQSGLRAQHDLGFARQTTEYGRLMEAKDIDLVVIASPPDLHERMVIDALRAGKAVLVDKPLAHNLESAARMVAEADRLGRDAGLVFEFRYAPAMLMARELIQTGKLGRVYSFRGAYFRSSYVDPAKPLRWKGIRSISGGGSLNDTAPHVIDLITWMIGPFSRLTAQTRTFIPERPGAEGKPTQVETDDHVLIQAALAGGGIGTIESGRLITGAVNDLTIEVYGEIGSLRWSLMDPNYLHVAGAESSAESRGWRQIPTVQRYPDAAMPGWDVPVGMLRFYIANLADFVRRTLERRTYDPGLPDGLRVQKMVDAAARAAESGIWVELPSEQDS